MITDLGNSINCIHPNMPSCTNSAFSPTVGVLGGEGKYGFKNCAPRLEKDWGFSTAQQNKIVEWVYLGVTWIVNLQV